MREQNYVRWRCLRVLAFSSQEKIESEMIQQGLKYFGLTDNTVVIETTRPEVFLAYEWTLIKNLDIYL